MFGDFHEVSVTEGALSRVEFGYTRTLHTAGDNPTFSSLWNNGFNITHGKVNLIRENAAKQSWLPAISAGFIVRTQVRNVGGAIQNKDTVNGDIYIVATKTVTQIKHLPLVFNGGYRATNAELWGMGGERTSHGRPRIRGSGACGERPEAQQHNLWLRDGPAAAPHGSASKRDHSHHDHVRNAGGARLRAETQPGRRCGADRRQHCSRYQSAGSRSSGGPDLLRVLTALATAPRFGRRNSLKILPRAGGIGGRNVKSQVDRFWLHLWQPLYAEARAEVIHMAI